MTSCCWTPHWCTVFVASSFSYETWFGGTLQKYYKDVKPLHIFDVISSKILEIEVLSALEFKKINLPPPGVRLLITFLIHSGIFSALYQYFWHYYNPVYFQNKSSCCKCIHHFFNASDNNWIRYKLTLERFLLEFINWWHFVMPTFCHLLPLLSSCKILLLGQAKCVESSLAKACELSKRQDYSRDLHIINRLVIFMEWLLVVH